MIFFLTDLDFFLISNITKKNLKYIIGLLNSLDEKTKIIFSVHPRTKKNLENFCQLKTFSSNIILTVPLGYIDFIALVTNCSMVLTDSGGIQEETTYLGIPCVTLRTTTERPVTVEEGTNYCLQLGLGGKNPRL
ncbi:MAG: UDP-N-acetylglucosamine 2-epimerase [Ignavibacteriaceae bacterium]